MVKIFKENLFFVEKVIFYLEIFTYELLYSLFTNIHNQTKLWKILLKICVKHNEKCKKMLYISVLCAKITDKIG